MFIFNYAFDYNQLQLFMGPIYLYRWHPTMSDHDMHEVCQFHLTALHPMLLILNIKSIKYVYNLDYCLMHYIWCINRVVKHMKW